MNRAKASKITVADLVAAAMMFLVGVCLVGWSGSRAPGQTLVVRDPSGRTLTLELREARTVSVAGLRGDTTIEIAGGRARFISSPCPHRICTRRGAVSRAGEWIVCVPNGVTATVRGEADYDGITP